VTITSFCEEDYAITIYIGEFINTISNLAYGIPSSPTASLSKPDSNHCTAV
jgi:ceramidase